MLEKSKAVLLLRLEYGESMARAECEGGDPIEIFCHQKLSEFFSFLFFSSGDASIHNLQIAIFIPYRV